MASSNDHCWLHTTDNETFLLSKDEDRKIRWQDTLRPLDPGIINRREARSESAGNKRKARPLSQSPHRKYSSTLSSRLKQKDGIKFERKPLKLRPVSCPPTQDIRPRNTVTVTPPSAERFEPKIRPILKTTPPQALPKFESKKIDYDRSPKQKKQIDKVPSFQIDQEDKLDDKKPVNYAGSIGSRTRKRKSLKRTRPESVSSYSSTKTVIHEYPGCQIM